MMCSRWTRKLQIKSVSIWLQCDLYDVLKVDKKATDKEPKYLAPVICMMCSRWTRKLQIKSVSVWLQCVLYDVLKVDKKATDREHKYLAPV